VGVGDVVWCTGVWVLAGAVGVRVVAGLICWSFPVSLAVTGRTVM